MHPGKSGRLRLDNAAASNASLQTLMKMLAPSKTESALLAPFQGLPLKHIHVPSTKAQFASATDEIKAAGVAGFDTESKPTFVRGDVSEGPHIVQFAIHSKAFIFQLHHADCRPFLIDLLESAEVLKVGFGLESDHGQIHMKLGIRLRSVLDLGSVFRQDGYRNTTGVRAAVAIVLNQNFHKSKRITTSNWASAELTESQLLYAANDAFGALKVLSALNRPHKDLPIR